MSEATLFATLLDSGFTGSGFTLQESGFMFHGQDFIFHVSCVRFRVSGFRCRISGSEVWAHLLFSPLLLSSLELNDTRSL